MSNGLLELAGVVLEALFHGAARLSSRPPGDLRAQAEKQFHAYRARSADGQIVLNGSSAQVLEASESIPARHGPVEGYVLTLFVVTPLGRYFLFKAHPSAAPFVRELTPERARLVLKDKFRGYDAAL